MRARALGLALLWLGVLASGLSLCPRAFAQAPAQPAPAEPNAAPASSASAPKVSSKLAPTTLQVGEVAKLVITVEAPASTEVSLPEQPFGGLELSDRHVRVATVGERTTTTYELDLLALDAGKLELPALTLRFVSQNGELSSASTEPQALTVRSLIANEPNAEPKPATQPISVMRDDYTLAWLGLGLLAIALIAVATLLISRWLKRRPKPPLPVAPPRPAWELAIERLHALLEEKEKLFANDRGEEFVDGVSDALREYLGKRYGFDGLERTTGELMATLTRLQPHKLSLAGVSQLLDECDLVKFARAKPDANQCQDLWNGAIGLIRATTPLHQPQSATPSRPPPAPLSLPPAPLSPAPSSVAQKAPGWSNAPPPVPTRAAAMLAELEDVPTVVQAAPVAPVPVAPASVPPTVQTAPAPAAPASVPPPVRSSLPPPPAHLGRVPRALSPIPPAPPSSIPPAPTRASRPPGARPSIPPPPPPKPRGEQEKP